MAGVWVAACGLPLAAQRLVPVAPRINYAAYTRATGLPSDYINKIYQDSKGYVWFAGNQGASRYDGARLRTLTLQDGLPGNLVYDIFEDATGRFWMGTFEGGVCRFDGQTTERLTPDSLRPALNAYGFAADGHGRVYCLTNLGVLAFDGNGQQWVLRFSAAQRPRPDQRPATLPDGGIIIPHGNELHLLQPTRTGVGSATLVSVRAAAKGPRPPAALAVSKVLVLPGSLVLAGEGGVWLARQQNNTLQLERQLLNEAAHHLAVDEDGRLYMGTRANGLYVLDLQNNLTHYTTAEGLPLNHVSSLLADYEGNLWVGTYGAGALRLVDDHLQWIRAEDGLPSAQINALYADRQDRFWMGTPAGWCYLQGQQLVLPAGAQQKKNIRAFMETPEGNMLLGTFNEAVGPAPVWQLLQQSYQPAREVPTGVSGFAYTAAGALLAGTYGAGVLQLDGRGSQHYTRAEGLAGNMVEDLLATPTGVWAFTNDNGATCLSRDKRISYNKSNGLPGNHVFTAFEQADGTMWLGVQDGLVRLRNGKVDTVLGQAEGLIGRQILCIFEIPPTVGTDALNGLFILTERYLHRVDGERLQLYGSLAILPGAGITINKAIYIADTRLVLLATTHGLVILDLSKARPKKIPPRVDIQFVRTADTVLYKLPNRLVLPFDRRLLTVHFSGLSFSTEEAVRFRYRIPEIDKNWSPPTPDREVTYAGLPPGSYTFELQALSADGIGSRDAASLQFIVLRPWYLRWWFFTLCGLLLVGALVLFVRALTRRKLMAEIRRLETERRIQAERERISRDLHDHVGAQLSSILSGLELTQRQVETPASMGVRQPNVRESLQTLEQDTRTTIGQLRETIWALQAEAIVLAQFVPRVQQYAGKLFGKPGAPAFALQCDAPLQYPLKPTEGLQVFRIVQEALHNVLKHAGARQVTLSLRLVNGALQAVVADDGTGFEGQADKALEGHYGLLNMRKRAQEIGATLAIETMPGGGTRVVLTLAAG
jgi:signal transduction histidine kinase/ligand-binding sensor domain-containing protein